MHIPLQILPSLSFHRVRVIKHQNNVIIVCCNDLRINPTVSVHCLALNVLKILNNKLTLVQNSTAEQIQHTMVALVGSSVPLKKSLAASFQLPSIAAWHAANVSLCLSVKIFCFSRFLESFAVRTVPSMKLSA